MIEPEASTAERDRTRIGERVIEAAIRLCGVSAIIFVFGIFYFVYREGAGFLWDGLDWKEFFTSDQWRPVSHEPRYGAFALISGTLAVTVLSMLMAVPLGLGGAVLVSEFCGPRLKETLKITIEFLAAIPSVVWGFIGATVMGVIIRDLTGAESPTNVLNASIILALMSLPVIVSIAEDALKAVPDSYREAAEALGATRWQITRRVLFPAARSGILAAVLLGIGRAIGETMAVYMATGDMISVPFSRTFPWLEALRPAKTLTATIAAELGDAVQGEPHWQVLFILGILLFAVTFVINLTADLIVGGIRKR